ncbi:alpha/beta fold hydrolase [Marinobacteraceae bacterium S3BR75-40.1]
MATRDAFWQGTVRGLSHAVVGGSQVVEGVHRAVLDKVARYAPVPPAVPVITRLVYGSVREVARLAGLGGEELLRATAGDNVAEPVEEWQLHAQSALNAAFGDYLEETAHPWALPMTFCHGGRVLNPAPEAIDASLSNPSPHLVVFIHGLGMNELAWTPAQGDGFAAVLEAECQATCLFLRYNTGRHIHENGGELADQLQRLIEAYPRPVASLTLVGHSMGGLVARSATYYAAQAQLPWLSRLAGVACLGSPHQGAPLELAGNWFTHALHFTPYTAPLASVGRRRSAGIKDLRFGSLRAEDWDSRGKDDVEHFTPHPVPLQKQAHYLVVGSTIQDGGSGVGKWLGDGIVPIESAMNLREETDVPSSRLTKHRFAGIGHIELLSHEKVGKVLLDWYREL